MPRVSPMINSFNGGEISPHLFGRTDINKYYSSCETIENFIVLPHGPAEKTPGTVFVGETKDSSKESRLITFQFSTTQAYILELGDQYMRVYKDNGRVLESEVDITGATKADPVVITTDGAHGYSAGDWVYISGVGGMTELNGKMFKVASPATDTFQLQDVDGNDIDGTGYTTYTSGGTCEKVYELSTPWTESQLADIQFAQSADTMWLVHPSHKPRELTRTGHTSWTLSNYTPTADPFTGADDYPSCVVIHQQRLWFANTNNDPQKLFSTKSGDYDDMTTGSNDDDAIAITIGSEKVNAIRWLATSRVLVAGTSGGGFSITGATEMEAITPTNISIDREVTFGVYPIVPEKIGSFLYYLQRNQKTIREMGYSFDIDAYRASNMMIMAKHIAGEGIVSMAYQQSPYDILWCVRDDGSLATLTREIEQEVFGWTRQNTDGSYESVSVLPSDGTDDEVWFIVNRTIEGTARRYVEYLHDFQDFNYDDLEDSFFVHSGLTLDNPVTITNATTADPVVITTSGAHGFSNGDTVIIRNVTGMTELNRVKFKVASAATDTFELQDTDGNDIDGSEYTDYVSGGEVRECVSSVSGLDHLEGEDVDILVDGAVHPQKTVSSGAVSLDWSGGQVIVGLNYISKIKPVRLEAGAARGTAQGKKKKIHKMTIRLYNTVGLSAGPPDNADVIPFRTTSMAMDEPVPLFSGDKDILMRGGWDTDGYIELIHDQALPCTVISIIPELSTND